MNHKGVIVGWALGSLAVAVGYVQWGWQGVLLAVTLVVFWLLLQFSRSLRSLRDAGAAPLGHVPSAVMLHARLRPGLSLPEVLRLTGSLGRKVADDPETFVWEDDAGVRLQAEMRDGRLAAWSLQRPGDEPPAA
ncbi:MAG: hypothetical protein U1F53_12435 [Burkholderiaceae bacterium]